MFVINKMLIRGDGMKKIKNLQVYDNCLIVIDMVNGFVREGVLHDKKIADVIPRQLEIVRSSLYNGDLLVFIKDSHTENSVEFQRFGNTQHCIRGSREAELVEEFREFEDYDNVVFIEKNSTSFMESSQFRSLIAEMTGLKRVDVIGCCTDICVANGTLGLSNYFDERNKRVDIYVHTDAVETYDSVFHERGKYSEAAKLLMEQQGIKLIKKK